MDQLLRHRSAKTLIAAALAVCIASSLASAQLEVPLPDVAGTYDEDTVTGDVMIPVTYGTSDAVLVVRGSQIAGEESSGCPPSAPYATGAQLHLYMYLAGTTQGVEGYCALYPIDGDFVVEMPLASADPPYGPLDILGGSYTFELLVLPGWSTVCGITLRMPVVTVTSASVVSHSGVAVERSTWGAVKGLFR
ncbi:MAG: hypothetical protein IPH48_16185 [bacterium]|jgi:hypothetical protein|nr:hypothetical protein [bacterium]